MLGVSAVRNHDVPRNRLSVSRKVIVLSQEISMLTTGIDHQELIIIIAFMYPRGEPK